eukprot:498925-Pleurochrysis_carterae.AAC.1
MPSVHLISCTEARALQNSLQRLCDTLALLPMHQARILTSSGEVIRTSSVVLTTGTFLKGSIVIGLERTPAGRLTRPAGAGAGTGTGAGIGAGTGAGAGAGANARNADADVLATPSDDLGVEAPSVGLAATLERLELPLGRLKTGTPPRLDGRQIEWDHPLLTKQLSDEPPSFFSHINALRKARRERASRARACV